MIITLITTIFPFIISYFLATKRNIGFAWSFFFCMFLTPIIGLIITMSSGTNNVSTYSKNNTIKIWAFILIWLFSLSALGLLIIILSKYNIGSFQITTFILSIGLIGLGFYLLGLFKGKVFNKIK